MTRLLSARLLNRLGEAHAIDPRVGLMLQDVDRFAVKEKGHTFRKSQTIIVTAEKVKSFGLSNVKRSVEIHHTNFMEAISSAQKRHSGEKIVVTSMVPRIMDWLEEREFVKDSWRDYGGEG